MNCCCTALRFLLTALLAAGVAMVTYALVVRYALPPEMVPVAATDWQPLGPLSGLLCGAVIVKSPEPMSVYTHVEPSAKVSYNLRYRLTSSPSKLQYYLLPGSTLGISACSKLRGAMLLLLQGPHHLSHCLTQLSKFVQHHDGVHHQLSEEEIWDSKVCTMALVAKEVPQLCKYELFQVFINQADPYYVVVHHRESNSPVSVTVALNRTEYAAVTALLRCKHVEQCRIDLPFQLGQIRPVVHMATDQMAGTKVYEVTYQCYPRFFLFFFTLVLLPISGLVTIWLCSNFSAKRSFGRGPKSHLLESETFRSYSGVNSPGSMPAPRLESPPPPYSPSSSHKVP